MKYEANWRVSGIKNGVILEAGDTIELKPEEAKELVECGALSEAGKPKPENPNAPGAALKKMNKAQLVDFAKKNHGVDLAADLPKEELLATVEALEAK